MKRFIQISLNRQKISRNTAIKREQFILKVRTHGAMLWVLAFFYNRLPFPGNDAFGMTKVIQAVLNILRKLSGFSADNPRRGERLPALSFQLFYQSPY